MTGHTESHAAVASITQALRVHWRRWLIPAALTTVLCTCYATVIYQPPWEVTQALTVRDEAASGTVRPGSFDTPETLKNYQETILELITSPTVVSAALQQVGPPSGSHGGDQWPTPIDIDKARGNIRIVPPNGTELGTTELFYLKVEDTDRQRALKLTGGYASSLNDASSNCEIARRRVSSTNCLRPSNSPKRNLTRPSTSSHKSSRVSVLILLNLRHSAIVPPEPGACRRPLRNCVRNCAVPPQSSRPISTCSNC